VSDDDPIQAAGGVLWRPVGESFEILLIHRPRYDDWTIPKGKVDAGDADLAATAEREVWEETGLRGRMGADLGEIQYTVKGRPKVVRYWAMELVDDAGSAFEPNAEVDELAWLPPDEAKARLVYLPDAEIIDRFLASWV
jgi:8-oxo-dGTP diphosphatase